MTFSASSRSTPLSNLYDASLDNVNFLDVFRINVGSKCATSINIFVVFSSTSELAAPITPAIATTLFASDIIMSSDVNSLS